MGEFFENLKPLWYEDQKYKCDKFSDPDKLLIYNYIVCVLAKYKDFYLKQGISVTSQGKNECKRKIASTCSKSSNVR